jgi:hemin uptake protein HemP
MQTQPLTPPTAAQHPHRDTEAFDNASDAALCRVNSLTLLQGRKVIEILHNGLLYRLQTTRMGKLILTK